MTGEELQAAIYADIREHAEVLRARIARKNAFKQHEISSQYTHA
jgi:hypothetical protein